MDVELLNRIGVVSVVRPHIGELTFENHVHLQNGIARVVGKKDAVILLIDVNENAILEFIELGGGIEHPILVVGDEFLKESPNRELSPDCFWGIGVVPHLIKAVNSVCRIEILAMEIIEDIESLCIQHDAGFRFISGTIEVDVITFHILEHPGLDVHQGGFVLHHEGDFDLGEVVGDKVSEICYLIVIVQAFIQIIGHGIHLAFVPITDYFHLLRCDLT